MGQAGDAGGGGGPAEALGWGPALWPLHVAGASLQPTGGPRFLGPLSCLSPTRGQPRGSI